MTSANKLHNRSTPARVSGESNTGYGSTGRQVWNPLGTNYGEAPEVTVRQTPSRRKGKYRRITDAFAEALRHERMQRKLSTRQLSELSGVRKSVFRMIECVNQRLIAEADYALIMSVAASWGIIAPQDAQSTKKRVFAACGRIVQEIQAFYTNTNRSKTP